MLPTLDTTPDLFRAFADPTRLRLLNVLLEGELCVCDLCDVLDVIQPNVSRHLAYLRRVGLVTVRQESKWKYYSIVKKPKGLQRLRWNQSSCCVSINVENASTEGNPRGLQARSSLHKR